MCSMIASRRDSPLALFSLFPSPFFLVFCSCDGDTGMELRCPGAARRGVFGSWRHSGVRPLEQHQPTVSAREGRLEVPLKIKTNQLL